MARRCKRIKQIVVHCKSVGLCVVMAMACGDDEPANTSEGGTDPVPATSSSDAMADDGGSSSGTVVDGSGSSSGAVSTSTGDSTTSGGESTTLVEGSTSTG